MTNSSPGPEGVKARRPGPRSRFFFHHHHGSAHGQDTAARSHRRHHRLHQHSHSTSPGYVDPASRAQVSQAAADNQVDSVRRSPEQRPAHAAQRFNTTAYPFTPGPESFNSSLKPRTLADLSSNTPLAGTALPNTAAIFVSSSRLNAATPTPGQGSGSSSYALSASLASPTTPATAPIASPDAAADFSAAADSAPSTTPWPVSDSTSAPSSTYPTIAGVHNGTATILNGNSSYTPSSPPSSSASFDASSLSLTAISPSSPPSLNSTAFGLSVPSTPTSPSFSSDISDALSLSTSSESTDFDLLGTATVTDSLSPTSALVATVTVTSSDDALAPTGAVDDTQPNDASGAGTKTENANGAMPQKARVIGGVVGSVAGLAFLAVLVLMALKLRKRRKDARALLGQGQLDPAPPRNITRTGFSESLEPCAVPVASSVADKRTAPHTDCLAEQGSEKGFYRVAGKKLPSVMFAGGDGFSDPRGSLMSEQSDYRGSTCGPDAAKSMSCRLALGVPMRPVSGIPIMRSSPARTPVTENPFADPSVPPAVQEETESRPPASGDSQQGSASRFYERL